MTDDAALHEACCEGDLPAVQRLIRAGAPLDATGFAIGSTPLILAAHRGHLAIVEALLDAGADPHAREIASDSTPLHWAAEGGHGEVAEHLLAAGARLEPRDGWHGLEPLGWATCVDYAPSYRVDRPRLIRVLLDRGAAVDPFSAIALGRRGDLADPHRRLGWALRERTPLHFAAARQDGAAVARLVDLGADLAARDAWGVTAAALWAHPSLGRDPGAPKAHVWVERDAPAELAAHPQPEEWLPRLVDEQRSAVTPLQLAAEWGREACVEALVRRGVALDAATPSSAMTALHFAAASGHVGAVRALLAAGADREARDGTHGATPQQWAEFMGHAAATAAFAASSRGG